MNELRTMGANEELRACVSRMVERLGVVRFESPDQWRAFADEFESDSGSAAEGTPVLAGPPAFVLKHAAVAHENFGFVMPVAQIVRPWQRATAWRDDATLGLWRAGWAPRAVDRILVPTHQAVVEVVIGDVRRVQSVTTQPDVPSAT